MMLGYGRVVAEPASPGSGKRGRPGGRTAVTAERLLDATVQIVAEQGVESLTYDAVAKLAGVSRATLHRKWPDRDDLIRDALMSFAEVSVSTPDTGDVRADIVELLCAMGAILETPVGRALVRSSLLDGNGPVRRVGRHVLEDRLAAFQDRIDAAMLAGELPAVDAAFLNTMLSAPVFIHVLRSGEPLTRVFAQRIVDTVFDGVRQR